ncbi:MAG: acetyl-CoA C-acyltransferase, partial [Planctomycetes bacterium]|nr:acetyl-CoA C-acyltransferase [Planctomycetota bacterium]
EIALRHADVVLAGGTESLSDIPILHSTRMSRLLTEAAKAKTATAKLATLARVRPRDLVPVTPAIAEPSTGQTMGQSAEKMAKENGISREAQDRYALRSHQLAAAGTADGRLTAEIAPVFLPPSFDTVVTTDNGIRTDTTLEALAKLRPVFDRRYGTVTAGNSCPISDGACALLLARAEAAHAAGYKPLAKIRSYAFAGLDPARMGLGPVYASAKALDEAGLTMAQIGLVELNEAFAVQVIACARAFDSGDFAREMGRSAPLGAIDPARMNVNGGAIALGHPVGTSGARLLLTLALEMGRRNVPLGLATLCIGGGQGAAFILERDGDCA